MNDLAAMSENAQIAFVILAFVVIAVAIWGLCTLLSRLLSWSLGRSEFLKRVGRRFDALDDAVDEELSGEDKFKLDVALQERTRGHSPETR